MELDLALWTNLICFKGIGVPRSDLLIVAPDCRRFFPRQAAGFSLWPLAFRDDAMAMKVTAELMSGEVIALDVPSEMKIKELKEELEAAGTGWDQQKKMFPEVSLKRVVLVSCM